MLLAISDDNENGKSFCRAIKDQDKQHFDRYKCPEHAIAAFAVKNGQQIAVL